MNYVSIAVYPFSAGIAIWEKVDGTTTSVYYGHRTSHNTWYNLSVDADSASGEISIYIDGTYVSTYTASTPYRTGLSGVTSGNGGAYFDNFELTSNDISVDPTLLIEVVVDIKPHSCPNPINVKSKGVLPVAILGSDTFDVSTIVATSVRLAGVEPIRDNTGDVAGPIVEPNECDCTTAGPDGFPDLTLKFKMQDIMEAIGEVSHDDILTLPLTGVLSNETPIEGADCILIRGKFKPINKADVNKDGVVDGVDLHIVAENWLQSSVIEN